MTLFSQMVVSVSNTDVLLTVLNYSEDLLRCTSFKMLHLKFDLKKIHKILNLDISKELLGFHRFTSYDLTGKFYGFTKKHIGKY